ncbi:ABC transporter ATP-binding protein [Vagococcus fessus]|uniref:ABC transporter ATP-binding protein n=1 Tax=Vagococcus fessus TaxID=120370 RepID=A0A430ABV4_9ENTE|nr:ATP-binding cassette domain-containing protein [Vagococcus fessus]RSU04717.1 ABC transporter ATP-binding protein [Vagococcus fessus]
MAVAVVEIKDGVKCLDNDGMENRLIMDHLNLTVKPGEFITVLGGNGAGKSTLFNSIAGNLTLSSGDIFMKGQNVTHQKEEQRSNYLARVFQDPKMGTAPRMTVAENLLVALDRGKRRGFKRRKLKENKVYFEELCCLTGNGLEKHLDTPVGQLSGGQRQALSLLMATMTKPDLLLLDEHTAALDPKTAKQIMTLTQKQIEDHELTCLMITHRMEDALVYGNRLIVLEKGKVVLDLTKEEKENVTLTDLLELFEGK